MWLHSRPTVEKAIRGPRSWPIRRARSCNSGVAIAVFVSRHRLEKKMKTRTVTRTLLLAALMLNLGVGRVNTQKKPVKKTLSGTNVATTINLQANTVTDETQLAGRGTLGQFTFRELHADGAAAQAPSGCLGPFFGVVAG